MVIFYRMANCNANLNSEQPELNNKNDLFKILESNEEELSDESLLINMTNSCCYREPCEIGKSDNYSIKQVNDLSFFHLNCRGLSNNWERFRDLIDTLHNEYFSFDFIGISESYKHEHDIHLHLSRYHDIISANRANERRGGVALFIKSSFHYKIRNDLSVFIPNIFESVFVEFEYIPRKYFIVGTVYRPNTPPKLTWTFLQVL